MIGKFQPEEQTRAKFSSEILLLVVKFRVSLHLAEQIRGRRVRYSRENKRKMMTKKIFFVRVYCTVACLSLHVKCLSGRQPATSPPFLSAPLRILFSTLDTNPSSIPCSLLLLTICITCRMSQSDTGTSLPVQ